MPRFYFHLRNDIDAPDDEGKEFPDLDAARAYARSSARFEAAEAVRSNGRLVLDHRIDIEDENGRVLDTVFFKDVVEVEE